MAFGKHTENLTAMLSKDRTLGIQDAARGERKGQSGEAPFWFLGLFSFSTSLFNPSI